MQVFIYIHIHMYMHIYTHIHIYTYENTPIYTHWCSFESSVSMANNWKHLSINQQFIK